MHMKIENISETVKSSKRIVKLHFNKELNAMKRQITFCKYVGLIGVQFGTVKYKWTRWKYNQNR